LHVRKPELPKPHRIPVAKSEAAGPKSEAAGSKNEAGAIEGKAHKKD
jgi:hypothetical protein